MYVMGSLGRLFEYVCFCNVSSKISPNVPNKIVTQPIILIMFGVFVVFIECIPKSTAFIVIHICIWNHRF